MENISILIVDDNESARLSHQLSVNTLFKSYESSKLKVYLASDAEEMLLYLKSEKFHVVLLDHNLGEDNDGEMVDGVSLIPSILKIQPNTRILVITSFQKQSQMTQLAVQAMENGARGFITKGTSDEEIKYKNQQILNALQEAQFEIESLQSQFIPSEMGDDYICKSKAMRRIDTQIRSLSEVNAPVLFLGSSGLGKTHAAKRLNELSRIFYNQTKRPFANINVNALSEKLIESELFGHEKGAFTGAIKQKQGLFELASGGDILLDEIGDASLDLQAKLLKVVEEKTFRRVGGEQDIKSSARIIFATNKNLEEMVEKCKFKYDLYGRICAFKIQMPELKNRKQDIPYICENIAQKLKKEHHLSISYNDFPSLLKEYFQRDDIPFNIRGIRNDLERLMFLCPKKKNGSIDYTKWGSVLGYETTMEIESRNSNDIHKLMDIIISQIGEIGWPGISALKDRLEQKAFIAAYKKYPKNTQRAKALGLSASVASTKIKRYLKKDNYLKEENRKEEKQKMSV